MTLHVHKLRTQAECVFEAEVAAVGSNHVYIWKVESVKNEVVGTFFKELLNYCPSSKAEACKNRGYRFILTHKSNTNGD